MHADHDWCHSIYTQDPNGILVEFCVNTRDFTDEDRLEAEERLMDPKPPFDAQAEVTFYRAKDYRK